MYPCASRVVVELDEIHPQVAVCGRTHVGVQPDGLEDRSRTWRSIWSPKRSNTRALSGQQQGQAVREQRQEAGTLKESSRGQQQQ